MKRIIFILSVMGTLTIPVYAQMNHTNLKIMETHAQNDETTADPSRFETRFSYDRLRLYPIIANETYREANKDIGRFTLLKDAIEHRKIQITETGTQDNLNVSNGGEVSGTVNTLHAKNISADTIFIMAGEVVKGGKQDRVIAQDIVLAPGQDVDLGAFCVEKQRWTTKDNNGGQFTGYYNVSSMDIRKTIVTEKDQQQVWNKVDEHTRANGAESGTKAYTNLENSEEYLKQVEKYTEHFKSAFQDDPRVIGVIAVSGDKVIGCDLFATHDLFISTFPNLLHSYVGYAVTKGSKVSIGNEEVYAYLDKLLKDESTQKEVIEENGTVYEYKNKKLHVSYY